MSHEEIIRAFQQMRQNVGSTAEQLHELQSQASVSLLLLHLAASRCSPLHRATTTVDAQPFALNLRALAMRTARRYISTGSGSDMYCSL